MVKDDILFMLQNGDSDQRLRAMVMVAQNPNPDAVPYLERIARTDPDRNTRMIAQKTLDHITLRSNSSSMDRLTSSTQQLSVSRQQVKKKPQSTLSKFITFAIFEIIGVIMLVIFYISYQNNEAFMATANLTQGEVIDMIRRSGDDGDTYSPVVRFHTDEGKRVIIESSFSESPPGYYVGELVDIYYDPLNPRDAGIGRELNVFTNPIFIVIGIIGAIFASIGFFGSIGAALSLPKKPRDAAVGTLEASSNQALHSASPSASLRQQKKKKNYDSPIKW